MHTLRQLNRLGLYARAGLVAVVLGSTACTSLRGDLPGATGNADPTSVPALTPVPTPPTAQGGSPTPGVARAASQANQPVAVRRGSIAQTLSVAARVVAPEEVPLAFTQAGRVKTVSVKVGQSVDEGQALAAADPADIQHLLDAATARLDTDSAILSQTQAAAVAAQQAAARQAAAAQASQVDQVAQATANLNTARTNLQRLQAAPSAADVKTAQNAVTGAQIALRKAEADQAQATAGPDPSKVADAEQELATDQAAVARAQADVDTLKAAMASGASGVSGSLPTPLNSQAASAQTVVHAAMASDISPAGVSTDFGNPKNNYGFQAIAVDPTRPTTVYAGTCYQGLWKTTDGGQTWAKIDTGTNATALDSGRLWLVVIDPAAAQTIFASPGYGAGGLWRSLDGGVNWTALFASTSAVSQQLGGVPTPSNLAIDPANHLHMLASSHFPWGGKYAGFHGTGVLETSDGGNTWAIHDPIQDSGAEHEVAFMDNSSTWIETQSGHGTYRTTDAGHTWAKVSDKTGEAQNMLAAGGAFYMPSVGGVMRSTDSGASWQTGSHGGMAISSDGVNLYTQSASPGNGKAESLFVSSVSDGLNWTQYSDQTMCNANTCNGAGWMAYDATNRTIYSSDWDAGIWKLQLATGTSGDPVTTPAPSTGQAPSSRLKSAPTAADLSNALQVLQRAKDATDAARTKLQVIRDGPDQNTADALQLAVDNANSGLQGAQAHLAQLTGGPNPTDLRNAVDAVTKAQAGLDRARAGGGATLDDQTGDAAAVDAVSTAQGTIDKDSADVANLAAQLTASQLVAPFAGTVVAIQVKTGDVFDAGKTAIQLAKPGTPILQATITPGDADSVSVGQTALITLLGQAGTASPITATITSLKANDAGTAKIAQFTINWPDVPPKLGTVVDAALVLQQKSDVLLVPRKAVHTAASRSFVELLEGAKRRIANVQVGIVGSQDAEIVSGLSEGQLVIVGP